MPLSYEDILDRWDRSRAFGDPRDLPTFSQELNDHTGTNDYDAGLPTGVQGALKKGFTRAEQNVFNPIASVTTEPVGRQIGSWFGNEELGAKVGRSIPEVAAFALPAAAAELASGGAATPLVAAGGAALTGSLFGAKTYADTGSPTAAAISGATGAVLPGVSKFVGGAVAPLVEGAAPYVAKAAQFGAGQAAQIGTLETSNYLQAKALGQPFDPLDPEFIATQIPFTALDLVHTAMSKPVVKSTTTEPTTERPEPVYQPPPATAEADARVDAMLSKLEQVMSDPNATQAQKEAATSTALSVGANPTQKNPSPMEWSISNEPVTVTGRIKPMPNGNIKMLVDPDRSDDIGLQDHRNVFVNDNADAKMVSNPDGTVSITTPLKTISHNVTSPLEPDDFKLPDPNQPNLPVQPKEFQGFTPDEQRTLKQNDIPVPEAESKQVHTTVIADAIRDALKQNAQQLDQTQATINDAKTKIATQPQTAEDYVQQIIPVKSVAKVLTREDADKIATTLIEGGINEKGAASAAAEIHGVPISAISAVRKYLLKDGLGMDQIINNAEFITKGWDDEKLGVGKTFSGAIPTKFAEGAALEAKLKAGATPTQAVEDTRVSTQTKILDDATTQQNILRERGKEIATAEPQEPKGVSMRMRGKVVKFDNEAQAAEFLVAYKAGNPTDATNWTTATRGTGDKAYSYIRQRTGGKVSLEAGHGEGDTATVENLLAKDEGTETNLGKLADSKVDPTWVPPDNRPDISKSDALASFARALKEPAVFARAIGLNGTDPLDVIQATRYAKQAIALMNQTEGGKPFDLNEVNKTLKAQGTLPLQNAEQAQRVLKIAGTGADEFTQKYRDFTLGSSVPDNEGVRAAIMTKGAKAVMEDYFNDPKNGVLRQLAQVLHNFIDYDKIDFTDNYRDGWYYKRDENGQATINVGSSINNNQALTHELAHHVTADLATSDTPSGVKLRATIIEAMDAVRKKGEIPQKVKEAITKSINGDWYNNFRDAPNAEEGGAKFLQQWRSVAGHDNDEWIPVFYALQHPQEMIPQMFSQQKFVELLDKTEMPSQKTTVLNYFSKVWNRLFGGGDSTDTALGELIKGLDNYLAGPKLNPPRQKPIFSVAGKKDTLLRNSKVADIVTNLAQGKPVTDAFGGSGQLAAFMKEVGGDPVTLNVYDPEMHAVFDEVKNNTEAFANRVKDAVAPIESPRRVAGARQTVSGGGDITEYLNKLQKTDPNVATLIKQNLSAQGNEVTGGKEFYPGGGLATAGLRDLPDRITTFAQRVDTLSNQDGWDIVAKAKAGDNITVDPPYIGKGGRYAAADNITVDQQLQNYEKSLYPAAERGAKFVVFDIADPKLMDSLRQHGFTVEEVQRPQRGTTETKPELVAYNYELGKTQDLYNGRDFIRDSLVAGGVRPEYLGAQIDTVENLFKTGDLTHSIAAWADESGMAPDQRGQADVNPDVKTAIQTGVPNDVHSSVMNLLADQVPIHQGLYWQMKNDLDIATSLYKNIKSGNVPGSLPPDAFKNLQYAQVKLNAMKRALGRQGRDIERINQLNNFTIDGMLNTFGDALQGGKLPSAPDPTGLENEAHALLGIAEARTATSRAELEKGTGARIRDFVIRNLMLTQYAKLHIPGFEPVADHVFQNQGDSSARMARLNFVRGYDPATGDLSKKIIKTNQRVEQNPNLNKVASDIRRWAQVQGKEGKDWSLNDPFVKNILGRSGDPEAIKTEFESAQRRRNDYVDQVAPQFLAEHNLEQTAKVIGSLEPGMKSEVMRDLSTKMYGALAGMQDPQNVQFAMADLQALRSQMQPDTFMRAVDFSRGMIDDANKHLAFLQKTPWYVTEQRFDKHHLVMVTPDGKPYRASFASKDEAQTKLNSLEKQGYKLLEYVPKSDANVSGGIRDDVISSMKELDSQVLTRLAEAYKDKPELLAQLAPMTQRASDYDASQAAFAPVPGGAAPRRQFIAGREEINMVTNDNLFYAKAVNFMRHKLIRAKSEVDFLDPDLMGNRASLQYSQQHVDNYLTKDNEFARKLVEATYNWKLAWNFGVNFLHGIQSLTSGMSSLIADTGGVGDAFKLTAQSIKSIIQRATTGKWDDPKLEWLANRLVTEGHSGIAGWSDIYGDQLVNMQNAARNNNPFTKTVGGITSAARNWTGMFLKFNDQVGAFAGFALAKERGMSDEDAFNFAVDVKNRAYYTGGKAQRAVGLWSIKSKPVPQLISSLQTYTYGWFSQLMSNYIRGFGKAPEGLTAGERTGAKKAFLYQLGAQAVMAGALGLPGVGQGIALAKQASGVDIKAWLRQHLGEMFGEDQDNGGLLTMLALHGAVASAAPFDPSGRHIPTFPFLGVSPYKGFDVANLASAPVSAAADVVRGLMAAAKGDSQGASALLPHVLSGPFNLWQGEGDVRDKSGNLVTKLSTADKVITALGMTPTRVTIAKDTANAAKQASAAASQEKSRALDKIATVYRKNGVTAGQTEVQKWFHDHPEEHQPAFVRSVASKVTAQTTPVDWRRGMNPAADLSGLSSSIPASEVQRRMATAQTAQSLGLFQRQSPRSAALAQQLDDLMNSDPTLGRGAALQELSAGRPSRSRYSVLPQTEYQ